jgi:hypothetical protein
VSSETRDNAPTLDQAVAEFEKGFEKVVEFDPEQPSAVRAPDGSPYQSFVGNAIFPHKGIKAASPEQKAVQFWFNAMMDYKRAHPGKYLYWRQRPAIEISEAGHLRVYCRVVIGNAPSVKAA